LFVGQWTSGDYGEDRKDIGKLIKVFYEAYANKSEKPALILKTSGAGFSVIDKQECLKKIKTLKDNFPNDFDLPSVYLLHGDLSDEQMNELYNHPKVKVMTSFTHGEGFGRPLLEASFTGLPIITTNWSGHTDFLNSEKAILLPGKIDSIPKSVVWDDILIPESKWFYVDENTAYNVFNKLKTNMFDMKRKAESLMNENRNKFTLNMMNELMGKILDKHLSKMPKAVGLKLPKLKKVSDTTKTQGIKLPKLKKV
jgi:glycosyltransferase involved in cell wall biosynthesis